MFVQIIQGSVTDPNRLAAVLQRWENELAAGATGWLGTTAGVTDDGQMVTVVRFASEDDARRNSDRPEQGAWWQEFSALLDGEATFHDCRNCEVFLSGGADDAGFVQVIQSQIADRARLQAVTEKMSRVDREEMGRPDLIGGIIAWHSDEEMLTQVMYFTSEAEARANEVKDAPAEANKVMDEWDAAVTAVRYFDLRRPLLVSPSAA